MSEIKRVSNLTLQSKKQSGPYIEGNKLFFSGPLKVAELARLLKIAETQIIKTLFLRKVMITINSVLETATIGELCLEYNFDYELTGAEDESEVHFTPDDPKLLENRPSCHNYGSR